MPDWMSNAERSRHVGFGPKPKYALRSDNDAQAKRRALTSRLSLSETLPRCEKNAGHRLRRARDRGLFRQRILALPELSRLKSRMTPFWRAKIEPNMERDKEVN